QVARAPHERDHEHVEPPGRERIVQFLDAVVDMAGGLLAVGFLALAIGEQYPCQPDESGDREHDDPQAPETSHYVVPPAWSCDSSPHRQRAGSPPRQTAFSVSCCTPRCRAR